jgi:hypothetical protein
MAELAPLQRLRGPGGVVLLVRRVLVERSWYYCEGIEACGTALLTREQLLERFDAGELREYATRYGMPFALVGGTYTALALDGWARRGKPVAWLASRAVWE